MTDLDDDATRPLLRAQLRRPDGRRARRLTRHRSGTPRGRDAYAPLPDPGRTAMQVPLTTLDFLERAETVFADRIAVVDEPDPPGGGLGTFTYARARPAGAVDRGRVRRARARRRRAHRDPLAQRGPLPDRAVRHPRPRARPGADQLPAQPRRDRVHHRALRRVGPARGPRVRRAHRRHPGRAPLRARRRHRRRAVRASGHARASSPTTRPRPPRSTTRRAPPRAPRACR